MTSEASISDLRMDAASINELLIRMEVAGVTSAGAIERAQRAAGSDPRTDNVLVKLGLLDEEQYVAVWSEYLAMPRLQAEEIPAVAILPDILSARFLKGATVLPLRATASSLDLAVADPLDRFLVASVRLKTGLRVNVRLASRSVIRDALDRLYPETKSDKSVAGNQRIELSDIARLRDLATDAPAILAVNSLIEQAVELKASDIHLTNGREGTRVRYRVDGVLQPGAAPSAELHDAMISRMKVLAELDITEKRQPQDGRIRFGVSGREIDLRVATMPHIDGEGVVLRILDRTSVTLDLKALGFGLDMRKELQSLLSAPHGIFLVTGPTGSGKTTTLYAALRQMVRPELNVVTVEDPVEYHLDGVSQIQVHKKIGLDFAAVLRAILRQDPDIIMVGEIRDSETAIIANQAALTGHFVLATLHTNTAAASIPRLIDMGIEPYLLSSTIRGALSQRLIRLLCSHCARSVPQAEIAAFATFSRLAEAAQFEVIERDIREPIGCRQCNGSGYAGRAAIAELIVVDDELRNAILNKADSTSIEARFRYRKNGSLLAAGLRQVVEGRTSISELVRVLGEGALQ